MNSCTVEHILIEELIYFFSINYVLKNWGRMREKKVNGERQKGKGQRTWVRETKGRESERKNDKTLN